MVTGVVRGMSERLQLHWIGYRRRTVEHNECDKQRKQAVNIVGFKIYYENYKIRNNKIN